ncbi:MAG TPA: VWA domain-containing protein [Ideonella sp.]|uniref:VWA domain-containing protein n=1 Tax=Ideonella sp. TaxID=1929293 RepID=UPI002C291DAF|nr:VWA domain-containing protein [Ideonella sp.]HSI47425.1 VWA domain-containing protein [Ideonella sp.]
MALTLNLQKSQASLQLCLQKAGVTQPPVVDMAFLLDVSGSFEDEHREGITNDLLTRLVPWGLTFDPDKKLDVITFSHSAASVFEVGAVTADNYQGYVGREIVAKVPGWCGGTDYSHALEQALRGFGWLKGAEPGLLGKLFGRKAEVKAKKRSLVVMVTDGENNDHARTRQVLRESQQRGDEVYFLFLGISNQPGQFGFLEAIGDEFDNTGFLAVTNLRHFVAQSDDELNQSLLLPELLTWLKR